MQFLVSLLGLMATTAMFLLSRQEMRLRQEEAIRRINTTLILKLPRPMTLQGPGFIPGTRLQEVPFPLWSCSYMLGRRRIRCDLNLSPFDPLKTLSREHALLTFDGSNFRITPVLNHKTGRYSVITVNGAPVGPDGQAIGYEDMVGLGSSLRFYLIPATEQGGSQ